MFEELKNEWRYGKKMYLFQLCSIILFALFVVSSGYIATAVGNFAVNIILIVWMLVNSVSIVIYAIKEYIKILNKENDKIGNLTYTIIMKVLFFIAYFSINTIVLLASTAISIPALALLISFWVVAYARKSPQAIPRNALTVIGFVWFIAIGGLLFIGYPLLMTLLVPLMGDPMVPDIIINNVYLAIAVFGFLKMIKVTEGMLQDKGKNKNSAKALKKTYGTKPSKGKKR